MPRRQIILLLYLLLINLSISSEAWAGRDMSYTRTLENYEVPDVMLINQDDVRVSLQEIVLFGHACPGGFCVHDLHHNLPGSFNQFRELPENDHRGKRNNAAYFHIDRSGIRHPEGDESLFEAVQRATGMGFFDGQPG